MRLTPPRPLILLIGLGGLLPAPVPAAPGASDTPPAAAAEALRPPGSRGEFEEICRRLEASDNLYYGTRQVTERERELAAATEPRRIFELKRQLGDERLRFGANVEAAQLLSEALQPAAASGFEKQLQKAANRITAGLVIAAMIVGAALIMRIPTLLTLFGYPMLAILLFLSASLTAAVLLWRILRHDH